MKHRLFYADGTEPCTEECLSPVAREELHRRQAVDAEFSGRPATPDEMREDPDYARLLDDGWCLVTNEGQRPNPKSPGRPPEYVGDLRQRGFELARSDAAYLYGNPACGIRLGGNHIAVFCRPTASVSGPDFRAYAGKITQQGGQPKFAIPVSVG